MPQVREGLPALYTRLLPEWFEREVPRESKATCSSCAMCPSSAKGAVESVDGVSRLFRPDTKCCTYYPRLPNYLVGALLADERPELAEGRRRMREKLASRVGVTPQWVRPSAKYNLFYDQSRRAFGRAAALRCPYYDEEPGGCSIWPYREAVCSTFFCKYVAGEDGRGFWMSLKGYLALVEYQLSRYAVYTLTPSYVLAGRDREPPGTAMLSAADLDDQPPTEQAYREVWGEYVGREEEYYLRCAVVALEIPRERLEGLLGFDGEVALAKLAQTYAAASAPQLPRVLKLNPGATVQWLEDGSVALGSYSELDALALPGEAYGLLTAFTGREPVEAVRAKLRAERQADLFEDVLLALYQHRVLIEP